MEQLILTQFKLLPEHLQIEVLHYIQFLMEKIGVKSHLPQPKEKKPVKLHFVDFHFPEQGQSYRRDEIYGDDER